MPGQSAGRHRRFGESKAAAVQAQVAAMPVATLHGHAGRFAQNHAWVTVPTAATISRTFRRLGLWRKKTLISTEQHAAAHATWQAGCRRATL